MSCHQLVDFLNLDLYEGSEDEPSNHSFSWQLISAHCS